MLSGCALLHILPGKFATSEIIQRFRHLMVSNYINSHVLKHVDNSDDVVGIFIPGKKVQDKGEWFRKQKNDTYIIIISHCILFFWCPEMGRTDHGLPIEIHQQGVLECFAQILLFEE